jgi:hypothetical protein
LLLSQVNPVRNSSGALNPAGIILKSNPAAEQRGIISNGVNKRGRRSTMPLSDDTKAIIASNLVVAQELRRLVSATLNSPMKMDYCEDAINIYQRIMARLSDLNE